MENLVIDLLMQEIRKDEDYQSLWTDIYNELLRSGAGDFIEDIEVPITALEHLIAKLTFELSLNYLK